MSTHAERFNSIHIAVACYANEEEVLLFAKGIKNQTVADKITLHIVINKPTSDNKKAWFVKEIRKLSINTEIHYPSENLGYLHGGILGLIRDDRKADTDWYVICNTDLVFPDMLFFETLLESNFNSDIGALAPDVVLQKNGSHQNPFMVNRPSKRSMKFRKICFSSYFLYQFYLFTSKVKHLCSKTRDTVEKPMNIYAAHGCFLCMRYSVVDELSKGYEGLFMYGEELLVAEIVRKQNKQILYDPTLKVMHLHRGTNGKEANLKKQKWFKQSINLLYCSFFS